MIKELSAHSINRYSIRTGRHSIDAISDLREGIKKGVILSLNQVKMLGFNILREKPNDYYVVWYDDRIDEDLCGVVSEDETLKTVLTKNIYSVGSKKSKIRNDLDVRRL